MRSIVAVLLAVFTIVPPQSLGAQENNGRAPKKYSSKTPDANGVREVVMALGVGKNVRLETLDGRSGKGRITAIGEQSFSWRRDGNVEEIPFRDVSELRGAGMRWGVKVGIIAGSIVGAILTMTFICYASQSCYS
jgi:hypothetical protein